MGTNSLAKLLDSHAPALVLFAKQWCTVPEDVVQEAFIKLFAQTTTPDNPVAWLYRVVRNRAINEARADRRRKRREQRVASESETWFVPPDTNGVDAEEATRALRNLPVEQREVIVAHVWGGLTFQEIARTVRCSSSTAHRRYLAGIESLRDRLESTCQTTPTPTFREDLS
ncbi:MAG: RNA polymerase sigma factor [Gemmataceae bacterium]